MYVCTIGMHACMHACIDVTYVLFGVWSALACMHIVVANPIVCCLSEQTEQMGIGLNIGTGPRLCCTTILGFRSILSTIVLNIATYIPIQNSANKVGWLVDRH